MHIYKFPRDRWLGPDAAASVFGLLLSINRLGVRACRRFTWHCGDKVPPTGRGGGNELSSLPIADGNDGGDNSAADKPARV